MTNNNQQPRPDDAVLGDFTPDISTSPVMGGLEGTVQTFTSNQESVKIASLQQALLYGEKGLDLILLGLKDPLPAVQKTAYLLLKDRTESRVIERLNSFCQYRFFECLWTLSDHSGPVYCVAISPDLQNIVSGSEDKTIKVWDINTKTGKCLRTLSRHLGPVNSVAISPDAQTVVSGSRDESIKVWDMDRGQCLKTLQGHSWTVTSLAVSLDGNTIIRAGLDSSIKIWDMTTGECLHTLRGHSYYVSSVAISLDGKTIVSGSWDKTIKIWGIPE